MHKEAVQLVEHGDIDYTLLYTCITNIESTKRLLLFSKSLRPADVSQSRLRSECAQGPLRTHGLTQVNTKSPLTSRRHGSIYRTPFLGSQVILGILVTRLQKWNPALSTLTLC